MRVWLDQDGNLARPLLTSNKPDVSNGAPNLLALCDSCGTVKAFNITKTCEWPDTGNWTECRACGQYRMFYRLDQALPYRVVNTKS